MASITTFDIADISQIQQYTRIPLTCLDILSFSDAKVGGNPTSKHVSSCTLSGIKARIVKMRATPVSMGHWEARGL